MIKKAVIPAAGLGTRLLSVTKEQPKEMLPIFTTGSDGKLHVKPLLQQIFEQLYDAGFADFCFIIGRGKRAIEDHFTPDHSYIDLLNNKKKNVQANDLSSFYQKIWTATIIWVNQPEPRGFGDAVLKAQPFVENKEFLVHAGDTYIISQNNSHLKRLIHVHNKLKAQATFIVQEVKNPKYYGVVKTEELDDGIFKVKKAIEKPKKPPTNLAIMPIYIFKPTIFKALEEMTPRVSGEIQLTDGIQKLINWGYEVCAIKLQTEEIRLDIGTPESYWEALTLSYQHFSRM